MHIHKIGMVYYPKISVLIQDYLKKKFHVRARPTHPQTHPPTDPSTHRHTHPQTHPPTDPPTHPLPLLARLKKIGKPLIVYLCNSLTTLSFTLHPLAFIPTPTRLSLGRIQPCCSYCSKTIPSRMLTDHI